MKTSGPVYFLGLTYTSTFGVILTLILHSWLTDSKINLCVQIK